MRQASLASLLVAWAVGCVAPAAQTTQLSIFLAASLGSALERAADAYETAEPGVRLTLVAGSSAALRTQIEHGAPADVFLSADETNAQALVDAGLTDGSAVHFASNELAIVIPAGNPGRVQSPADLARVGVKVIAAGEQVPISRYAEQLVEKLAALPGYVPDFAARYAENVVSREDDVTAVVAKIALAEGDAAIAYATDARAAEGVSTIAVPDEANVAALYSGVVLARSARAHEARRFLDWLVAGAGQRLLAEHGFGPPPSE